jgi:hypothetical protein
MSLATERVRIFTILLEPLLFVRWDWDQIDAFIPPGDLRACQSDIRTLGKMPKEIETYVCAALRLFRISTISATNWEIRSARR